MFEDRVDAANKLCPKLKAFSGNKDVIVVGLTRGGVVTAKAVSDCLRLKLKALVVKKIPAPSNEELAIGAMASSKALYWNKPLLKDLNIGPGDKAKLVLQKQNEIKILEKELGIKKQNSDFRGKIVILVDDGVATGASVIAAQKYLRKNKAKKIILATPVIALDTLINIKRYFDRIIYLIKRRDFYAVGEFYNNFEQISNEEVARILATSH